jgi:hypothetical protein
MLMGVTSWELGVLRVPLIMVPDNRSVHLVCTQPGESVSDIFNPSLKFAPTGIQTQDLMSAT